MINFISFKNTRYVYYLGISVCDFIVILENLIKGHAVLIHFDILLINMLDICY